jgi:hypothetical protein
LVHKLIIIFKFIEPLFWLAQLWMVMVLIRPRFFFESNLKLINRLLIIQGFEIQLPVTDKAFKIWRRDIWILFFLNPLIIILIHLINMEGLK